jgi:hypothetical protein
VVGSRREVWTEDELTLEPARIETAVCVDDLIKRDPFGDTRSV